MKTLQEYLDSLFPNREIQSYVLWILAKAYFSTEPYRRPFVVFRGHGGNGKSFFTKFLMMALDNRVILGKKPSSVGNNTKIMLMGDVENIVWWRWDDFLDKYMPICVNNIYPKLKDARLEEFMDYVVIPFESTFVDHDRVDPSNHMYIGDSYMTPKDKKEFQNAFVDWIKEFPAFLEKVYKDKKEDPPKEPAFVKEERMGMRMYCS